MTSRLLGVLGVGVIALLVGLWSMLRDDDASAEAPSRTERSTGRAEQAPSPAAPQTPSAPSARSTVVIPRTQPLRTPSATAPSAGGPAAEGSSQEAPVEKPVTFHRTLDEQIGLSEPHLVECVEKAAKGGARVDGTTAVSFTIAKKPDGKLGIETTGVEYSSIPDQHTTDCIRDVGKSLNFESLPDGVDRVVAYRKVVVKDGKITENWLTEFAQNPDQTPPPPPSH